MSVSPETAATSERKVARAIMDRGHKVINRDTGEVDDFMPTATEIKNLAPKQRKVDKSKLQPTSQHNALDTRRELGTTWPVMPH